MRRILGFLVLVSVLGFATDQARAGVSSCSGRLRGGKKFDVEVTSTEVGANKNPVYTSKIKIEETSIPQLGAACFSQDRPGTRFVKCTHRLGQTRVEVYPTVETTSGAIKLMQFIIWDNAAPVRGTFKNCRDS